MMDADGQNRRRYLRPPLAVEGAFYYRGLPKWSPDGTRIVYDEELLNRKPIFPRTSTLFLYETRFDAEKALPLPEGWWLWGAIWIDNDTLLIPAVEDGLKTLARNSNIYRYHIPTGTLTQLTDLPGGEHSMDWHPDPLDVSPKQKKTTRWGEIKKKP